MKQRLINYLLKTVVKTVIPQDVIREIKGVLYLGKERITQTELAALQAEAKALKGMRLWSIINESVKRIAFERGWRDSTTLEHLNTAKTMYAALDLQSDIINKLEKMT